MEEEKWVAIAGLKDIAGAKVVEISVDRGRGVVWVNVDQVCALRVCRIEGPIIIEGVD